MIFQDKFPELIYFEECLINPPVFPGTLPTRKYLEEVSIEYLGHFKGINEVSEIVGEVWGEMCTKIVIGVCIAAVLGETGSKREIKKIESAFEKLVAKQSQLKGLAPSPLNFEKVSEGAAKNLNYLIGASQPNTVLQTEMSVSRDIQEVRHNALKQFAPSVLREYLFDGIEAMTGIRPSTL
jgi:hypothetical protein